MTDASPTPHSDTGVIDIHIHVTPWEMMHPPILDLIRKTNKDYESLLAISRDP